MPEQNVTIVAWPKDPAKLEHQFDESTPCPVKVSFGEAPAHVAVHFSPDERMQVDMNMAVAVRQQIPICIRLCEPICASSDYTVGISVFDTPVFSIRLQGLTRLFNCRDGATPEPQPRQACVDFLARKLGETFSTGFTVDSVAFAPVAEALQIANFGDPPGRSKLEFPPAGVRIMFAQSVRDVRITLCNVGNSTDYTHVDTDWQRVDFRISGSADPPAEVSEVIVNTVKEVSLPGRGVSSVEVRHGNGRAALVRVCYTPEDGLAALSAGVVFQRT